MKKVLFNNLIPLFLFAASSLTGYTQEYKVSDQLQSFTLDGETKTTEIGYEVLEDYTYLKMKVACFIKNGEIFVELVDPSSVVRKTITVKPGPLSWDKFPRYLVQGVLDEAFQDPVKGNWTIRISLKEAEGELRVFCRQSNNSDADLFAPEQIELETISHLR